MGFGITFLVIGIIIFAIVDILNANHDQSLGVMLCTSAIGLTLLIAGSLFIFDDIENDVELDHKTQQRVENLKGKYDFYLDGEKVSYPDRIVLDDYKITINDDKKEVILRRY